MPSSPGRTKKLRLVFIVYWFLLGYILAALVWWFIELNTQNQQMALHDLYVLNTTSSNYAAEQQKIIEKEKRKTAQYIGEGSVFFLVILAGAVFLFRAVRNQLKLAQQQQNFMMAITHELKTPIAVTKLNLETLLKRKLDETQSQKLLKNSIQETNRLNALCSNILLVAQLEHQRYIVSEEELSLSQVAENCINDFISRYPQRNYIKNIAPDIYIHGDTLLLQMAINNLLDNATKYTDSQLPVTLELSSQDKQAILRIKDQGKGIPDTEKKKVFEKFYRLGNKATKEAKGTGLGLYLTQRIARQHGAGISIEDNSPTGSIFTITFRLKNA